MGPATPARPGAAAGPVGHAAACPRPLLRPQRLGSGGRGRWAPICLGGVVSSCFLVEELGGFSELMVYVLSPFVFWVC